LTLRTKLTLFYTIIVSLLLTGFALIYYKVLSVGLDQDLTQELIERTEGLRGYMRFENGKPLFVYSETEPEEVSFVRTATRYFQIYEVSSGTLLVQSPELEATGVQYSQQDVARLAESAPSFSDLHTDQGVLRFRYELLSGQFGDTYLLLVGAST